TQVLNLNYDNPSLNVRHQVTVDYAEDTPSGEPRKALFQTAAYGLKAISAGSAVFGADPHASMEHGPSCLPGESAKKSSDITDQFGSQFSGHWVVKPGREVNHTTVTRLMNIGYDTTIHYILVHLHPFAESLELVDLTAKNFKDRIGLERVGEFSSAKGIPVFKDHAYELISVYNNTTDQDQDAMAV